MTNLTAPKLLQWENDDWLMYPGEGEPEYIRYSADRLDGMKDNLELVYGWNR